MISVRVSCMSYTSEYGTVYRLYWRYPHCSVCNSEIQQISAITWKFFICNHHLRNTATASQSYACFNYIWFHPKRIKRFLTDGDPCHVFMGWLSNIDGFSVTVDWGGFRDTWWAWVMLSVKIQQTWMDSLHYLINRLYFNYFCCLSF